MPFVQLRGQRFRYEDTGGDGPALVFSHGILMDHTMYGAQVEEFRSDHRVITWDWRGFGETETDGKPFSIWDQVDDLFALLDHLEVERAVFGGMSHGGYITMRTPLVASDRVRGIIPMNTNATGLTPDDQVAYRQLFDAWMDQGPTDELCARFGDIAIGDPAITAEWTKRWQARPKDAMRNAIEVTITVEDISARLGEITCPALVIHGIDDKAFNLGNAANIAACIPTAGEVVEVPGGHAACMTHPELVNKAIREFLSQLPS